MTPRSIFPIARSIASAEALAKLLESAYGLREANCRLIKAMILDTYRVTVGDDFYILRIYPHRRRTLSEIIAELEFLLHLDEQGVAVSVPIRGNNDEYTLKIDMPEGERHAALFTYAPGRPLNQNLDPVLSRQFGHMIAQIHAVADTFFLTGARSPLSLHTLLRRPLTDLERVFGSRGSDWAFLRNVSDILEPRIAALPTTSPFYGLCHGDVGAENVHISESGHLTMFDFDFCGFGWRSYDVATFLIDQPDDIGRAFLAGYQEIRDLSPNEHAAIPLFQILQSIWVLGLRADYVDDWGDSYFSDGFVNKVLSFIRKTMNQINL